MNAVWNLIYASIPVTAKSKIHSLFFPHVSSAFFLSVFVILLTMSSKKSGLNSLFSNVEKLSLDA